MEEFERYSFNTVILQNHLIKYAERARWDISLADITETS